MHLVIRYNYQILVTKNELGKWGGGKSKKKSVGGTERW